MLFTVLTTLAVGRLLGADGLGRWTLIFAAGTLLHTTLVNWTHASTVRYGREEWARGGSLNRTLAARLPLVASGVTLAVALLVLQPARWLQRWFATDSSEWWMVALVALSVWLAAEAQATLQATDRVIWQGLLAPLVVGLSGLGLLVLLWSDRRSLGGSIVAFTIAPVVCWGGTWIYTLSTHGGRPRLLSFDDVRFEDVRRHLRYAIPLIPTLALGYASNWCDHLLLTRFSTLTEVGFFALSYQFFLAMTAANGVLTTLLLPRLIAQELEAPGSVRAYIEAEVPTLYTLWMIGTVWLVAALPIGIALLAGTRFDESIGVLLVLLVAIPSSVVTSLYTVLFNIQERMGSLVLYTLLLTLTNIAVSIVLIPSIGALGAAVGTALSYMVGQALYMWDQHRELGVPAMPIWTLWAAGLALGVAQLMAGHGAGARIVWAVVATLLLVGIVRMVGCVDGRLVNRLFIGRLNPVAGMINLVLVAKT
jgi:O-antigen/teichoic acid export membrane protein